MAEISASTTPAPLPVPLRLLGAPGSPYTRKMVALLRYRRIPHAVIWGGHHMPPPGLPVPKVKLLPTVYLPSPDGALEAAVDSTPIIRRLEAAVPDRTVLPEDPVLGVLNDLIEDFADEWLTKAMFHYRWAFPTDAAHAAPLLVFWSMPDLPTDQAMASAEAFAARQTGRLGIVGSNPITAQTIEAGYARLLTALETVIAVKGFVLGRRPASADFALHGQLTQLGQIEPTSAAVMTRFPRVRAWLDRVEDLSGLEPTPADWLPREAAAEVCRPLLTELGRGYVPFMLANAGAVLSRAAEVHAEIDGRPWVQPTFPYQAKCVGWLRDAAAALTPPDGAALQAVLAGTGCTALFDAELGSTTP